MSTLAPRYAAPPTAPPALGAALVERSHPVRWGRAWPLVGAFGIYQAIALAVWWRLLAHGFGAALPAGSADPGQEVWFLAWVPHALGAGTNPFFTRAVFAPAGVNLLANTSMELLGLLFAPVTVTAGPVASLDVAVLLAPALSALAAYVLCRRHVSWAPAAFAAGLCYGFGPFVAGDLRYAHLDLTWLALPPLIFCCLDALVLSSPAAQGGQGGQAAPAERTRHRTWAVGVTLGLLVVAQFFVSTELLAITALTAGAAAVLLAVARPKAVVPALRASWQGLSLALAIAVVALGYPVWVVACGPRHLAGPVWQHIGHIATSIASTVEPHGELKGVAFISGSNGSYLGIGLLVVLAAGAIVLWRSSTLRLALGVALVAYVLSLGYRLHVGHRELDVPLPAALLGHVALFDSIVPERFAAMVDLFCGIALAVVLDHVRTWDRPRTSVPGPVPGPAPPSGRRGLPLPDAAPLLVGLAVALGAFALVPLAGLPRWPYRVTRAEQPPVFTAPPLASTRGTSGRPLVALYPDSSAGASDEMVWQAEDGGSFSMPDGYAIVPGPGGRAVEAPPTNALWLVFAASAVHRLHLPLTGSTRGAVRSDLRAMHVDDVVVLPGSGGSAAVRRALTEVLGRPTTVVAGADRWALGR